MNSSSSNDSLERIRQRTRDVHRGLEALPIWGAAFDDLTAYAALLDGFLSLVRPADREIARSLGSAAPEWFLPTARSIWLESDRRDVAARIGDGPPRVDPEDDGRIGSIANASPAAAAGLLYVLEGSALGGRVISRRLHDSLGLDADCGARYFNGYGSETAERWRRFLAWLAATISTETEADVAADAAGSAFERFHERLAGLAHA